MDWVSVRREFHKIPELGFEEFKTQVLIKKYIDEMKKEHIQYEEWETGVIVKIDGKLGKKKIGFRCDIDGLPIKEMMEVEYKSVHEGKMHACGHDFHITFGLMLVEKFSKKQPLDDYIIIFQPAEEGPGGAEKLIKEKPELFKGIDHIFAFHVDPMMKTGVIGYNEKHLFAGTQEINIKMKSDGGHAAYPEKAVDLTEAFSAFYLANKKKKRKQKGISRTIVHLGKVVIGEARNSFPAEVKINGTIRAYEKSKINEEIEFLEKQLKKTKVNYTLEKGPYYHPVVNDEEKVEEMKEKLKGKIEMKRVEPKYTGEDFGFYGLVCPTVMMWIGAESECDLHTDRLDPEEKVLEAMKEIMALYIT